MAINDIALTSGMLNNLVSLQQTATLVDRTQERLSTGKKVNTALDNPLEFFTAQALNSRANDLSGFQDAMSEAVQTVQAANNGITGITALIQQAQAIAASAQSATTGGSSTNVTEQISLAGVANGDVITIGGVAFTASNSTGVVAAAPTTDFYVGGTDAEAASSLASAIALNGTVTSADSTAAISVGGVSGNTLSLVAASQDVSTGDVVGPADGTVTGTMVPGNGTDRANYAAQYNNIVSQINLLAQDSGYEGTNLLAPNNNLTVNFGTGTGDSLTINSIDSSAAGLQLSATATLGWATNANIATDVAKLNTATNTLTATSSALSSGLSIVTTRQDWVTSMINTLTTGANNLTLADMNQEGANMLMLQTRQALGTTALSLSSQAAQSVLKLFS